MWQNPRIINSDQAKNFEYLSVFANAASSGVFGSQLPGLINLRAGESWANAGKINQVRDDFLGAAGKSFINNTQKHGICVTASTAAPSNAKVVKLTTSIAATAIRHPGRFFGKSNKANRGHVSDGYKNQTGAFTLIQIFAADNADCSRSDLLHFFDRTRSLSVDTLIAMLVKRGFMNSDFWGRKTRDTDLDKGEGGMTNFGDDLTDDQVSNFLG